MYDEYGEYDEYAAFQVRTSSKRMCPSCGDYVHMSADQGVCTPCAEDNEKCE